jgi:hypothetical protein
MLYSSRKTKKTIKNACNDRIMNRQQKGADLMKNIEWKDKVASFKKIDVRGIAGNFLDGLKKTGSQASRRRRDGSHSKF